MEFTVGMNTKDVEALFKSFPRRCKAALADGVDHATRSFYSRFYKERLQGSPGIKARRGGIFHRFRRTVKINGEQVFIKQSGTQKQTTNVIMKSADDPMNMQIDMYSQSKVAGIHETGGVIAGGKAMPIPLNDTARALMKSPAALRGLSMMKINGKLFLGRAGRNGRPELLFILMRGIRVKPRLGFYMTWDKYDSRRQEIMNDALDKAMEKL